MNVLQPYLKKFLIVFLMIGCLKRADAQELSKNKEIAFKVGEQLDYKLKYGFFTAAQAFIKVEESDIKFNGQPAFHIVANGKTAGTFDVFYKVRNQYDTYIDKNTLLPYLYTEDRHEGGYK